MASEEEKRKVWEKGKKIRGKDPSTYRKDEMGNEIYWASYGKNSQKGWEIDHKKPVSKGGSESIKNKQPLQTKANKKKSNKYPHKKKRL